MRPPLRLSKQELLRLEAIYGRCREYLTPGEQEQLDLAVAHALLTIDGYAPLQRICAYLETLYPPITPKRA